ncbi:MAG: transcription elongation factor GreA [Acidobacteria bacterium]|nr:transcription elongation factor GreA [Acidobacteriota bacterium]
MSGNDWLAAWDELIATGTGAAIEEFWLARLAEGVEEPAPFMEALRRLRHAGKKTVAATLLELAEEQATESRAWNARRAFLGELLRLGIGSEERWRAGLEECVRSLWADRPSLAALLARYPLRTVRKPAAALEELETWLEFDVGGVFAMAGRGAGRVVEANPALGMLRLDFEKEKRVPMPIDAARKFLTALPPGHFLRRRLEERDALAREATDDPAGTLAALLESLGGPLGVPEIKEALGGLVPDAAWTGWWTRARKHPRLLTSGTGVKVRYRLAAGAGAEDELRVEFERADLEGRLALARRHGGRRSALGPEMARVLLADAGGSVVEPGLAWEALALAARLGADDDEVNAARRALLERAGAATLLAAAGDVPQREAVLGLVRESLPDWQAVYAAWLPRESNPRLLGVVATALARGGASDRVAAFLDDVFLHPQRLPAAFVWACEAVAEEGLAGLLADRVTGPLLIRLVDLAERREFGPLRTRLKEILSARGLAGVIVQQHLSEEQGKRLLQMLESHGQLTDERAWLRRAVAMRFPQLQPAAASEAVPALKETVVRLQKDLKDLLERQIPDTLKAIQIAKEHGDLRENFEYHAARARQELLSARAAQIQADLARVKVIDPATIDPARVRVGTRVRIEPDGGGEARVYTILGPYEADAERGVLSIGSDAAQALLDREAGEAVTLDGAHWTIAAIEQAT